MIQNFDNPIKNVYRISIKTIKGASSEAVTLYNIFLKDEVLCNLLKLFMIDEYSLFINDEKRLLSEDDKKENTHRLQLFKIVDKKQHSVLSFSFVNKFYGCNEVIQKINYWLKGGYLKDKKSFPDSKVKKIMESVKQ